MWLWQLCRFHYTNAYLNKPFNFASNMHYIMYKHSIYRIGIEIITRVWLGERSEFCIWAMVKLEPSWAATSWAELWQHYLDTLPLCSCCGDFHSLIMNVLSRNCTWRGAKCMWISSTMIDNISWGSWWFVFIWLMSPSSVCLLIGDSITVCKWKM